MKKRLIIATVLVLLLAIGLTLFVGCDAIFTRNDQRDMTQVVAKVTYNNETREIYKYELQSSFASYAYYYVNYYGMSAETAANYVLQSLAQQKLLVLFAREQVAKLDNKTKPDGTVPATADLLSDAENDKAVKDANDSLLSSLKSLVEDAITEDNYNNATNESSASKEPEEDDAEIKDPVTVRFESYGGTEIEAQRIQKGKKAKEPTEPTKDGYTFYGWYDDGDYAKSETFEADKKEVDFDTLVFNESKTLYAKWAKYDAPRTALPEEEEEEEEFDPEATIKPEDKAKPFFTWDEAKRYEEIKEEDFVKNIELEEGETLETVLGDYIEDAYSDLKKNLQKNLYKSDIDECWKYYLTAQEDTLIVDRFERRLGEVNVTVTDEEIENEYKRIIDQNKESFQLSDTGYSSALGSSLNSTYYHPADEQGYGFVTNILLRLDEESLNKLTAQLSANPSNKEAVKVLRNIYLSELTVKISNPKYDADAKYEDENGEEKELRDPMTDPANRFNPSGKTSDYDHSYQFKKSGDGDTAVYENNYNELITFGKKVDEQGKEIAGEYEIKFQATEHPTMAYLLETWPAFDKDGKTGIIHQIYNSFKKVQEVCKKDGLDKLTEVYWLRKMASTWAYLVGDDTGAVTSSSNNNGLGYLITPEGKDSSYLTDFTDYARKLIAAGTGSYALGEVTDDCFKGAAKDSNGTLAGDGKAFVVADSFIESGSTSNGYAGIFVLLNTYSVWDNELYKAYNEGGKDLPTDNTLPGDFVFDFTPLKDGEESQTIFDLIKENLETAKKTNLYNLKVNEMGNENAGKIEYFEKAYKSIWKDYE